MITCVVGRSVDAALLPPLEREELHFQGELVKTMKGALETTA